MYNIYIYILYEIYLFCISIWLISSNLSCAFPYWVAILLRLKIPGCNDFLLSISSCVSTFTHFQCKHEGFQPIALDEILSTDSCNGNVPQKDGLLCCFNERIQLQEQVVNCEYQHVDNELTMQRRNASLSSHKKTHMGVVFLLKMLMPALYRDRCENLVFECIGLDGSLAFISWDRKTILEVGSRWISRFLERWLTEGSSKSTLIYAYVVLTFEIADLYFW